MKNTLIIIGGIAGSGKTTLSIKLFKYLQEKSLSFAYIEKDVIQDSFVTTRDDDTYSTIREISYMIILSLIKSNMSIGNNVILVGPFNKFDDYNIWNSIDYILLKHNINLKYIWCYAHENTIKQRLLKRGNMDRDKWKLENWKQFLKKEPIMPEIPYKHICVNTERKINLEEIYNYIMEK